jgi:hypothetical protein
MAAPGSAGSLEFTITGAQIRKFKTALQSLGKIGAPVPRVAALPPLAARRPPRPRPLLRALGPRRRCRCRPPPRRPQRSRDRQCAPAAPLLDRGAPFSPQARSCWSRACPSGWVVKGSRPHAAPRIAWGGGPPRGRAAAHAACRWRWDRLRAGKRWRRLRARPGRPARAACAPPMAGGAPGPERAPPSPAPARPDPRPAHPARHQQQQERLHGSHLQHALL